MKKFITSAVIATMLAIPAFAQNGRAPHGGQNGEKVSKSEMIAESLALDEKQKAEFIPMFEQIEKENKDLKKAVREATKNLRTAIEEGRGENEILSLVEAYAAAAAANVNQHLNHYAEYAKVLPADKVAKFFLEMNKLGRAPRNPQMQAGAQRARPDFARPE